MRVGLIGTFHGRLDATEGLVKRILEESTRRPDDIWLLGEDTEDTMALNAAVKPYGRVGGLRIVTEPTPRDEYGVYEEIPYSRKINLALDHMPSDVFTYLDNGSLPHREKYERMAAALEENPDWGAVYCSQMRTGMRYEFSAATSPVPDAFCVLNYTQVMHRRTDERWPLDMALADPDVADGVFWRRLHYQLGPFMPVASRATLDEHYIPDAKAVGV